MMNHKWISAGLCVTACASAALLITGCNRNSQQQVAVAPPPPPPPPAPEPPKVTPIDQLMVELNIDPRVRLPEAKAPDNNEDRKAVLVFFDALTHVDGAGFKSMLPETDQHELVALIDSGGWKQSVTQIKSIDVQTGRNSAGQKCALAVIETGKSGMSTYQPQLWYYTVESGNGLFEAAPTPPGIIDKLTGSDWIGAWHKILADEMALADKPDEEFDPPQKVLDKGGSGSSGGGSPGGTGPQRGLRPGGPPIKAPGLPGGGERPGNGR